MSNRFYKLPVDEVKKEGDFYISNIISLDLQIQNKVYEVISARGPEKASKLDALQGMVEWLHVKVLAFLHTKKGFDEDYKKYLELKKNIFEEMENTTRKNGSSSKARFSSIRDAYSLAVITFKKVPGMIPPREVDWEIESMKDVNPDFAKGDGEVDDLG